MTVGFDWAMSKDMDNRVGDDSKSSKNQVNAKANTSNVVKVSMGRNVRFGTRNTEALAA